MTDEEIEFILDAIELTAFHFPEWMKDYTYDAGSNEYSFKEEEAFEQIKMEEWFTVSGD